MQGQSGSSGTMLIVLLMIGFIAAAAAWFLVARRRPTVQAPHAPGAEVHAKTAPVSLADELSELAALRDKGVLSHQEFEAEKAKLLSANS